MERIYLDNAATSWPKPPSVYAAVQRAMQELGAPAGRSAYREAAEVERRVAETRRRAAVLWGIDDPQRIVFTCNATDSLNLALHGILSAGDHVITTPWEHNSVLRPLRQLQDAGVEVSYLASDGRGSVDPDQFAAAVRPHTRMIALVHASNVTGVVQPVEAVGRLADKHGILLLVDAAQTAGHWPIDVNQLGCALLAAPAHKGLLGPLGVGLLYIAPGVERQLRPVRQGGTGTLSERDRQPSGLPDKFESGNHNVPGILGLEAGLQFVQEHGVQRLCDEQRALTSRLLAGLQSLDGVAVVGPADPQRQVGVVSLKVDGYQPQEVASMLDSAYRIQVRSGLHCAPRAHQALGTIAEGGTVRLSLGPFTTEAHVDAAVRAIAEIASSAALV